ncbi:oxidoreductase [Mycobacterium sp. CBMA293]|uniref:oxidoreductase n=1 Tax=unclassified Mycolicibacterium TaxID=2636767 RepID=UPI001325F4CB|nr:MULTISPECIES: oxidoreductase [unclassified Mycolicibacterium]MUL47992.1 oxidoreductase [Mycolicibacterium sp. CBMA 360]MUL93053.1 oxidoreductase [Mycolicibacterium sp. CBMA 230]MUL58170.1 oxidoreductase [Mycolicibacterium sp. CBMA 335]MUL73628.1 oxidoreductase [Mycolicibacterium sp. CBMA 311]MUM07602.1 2-dehydropantoate 2-reductase [Mycolicibacterium sp. CBMA 213]
MTFALVGPGAIGSTIAAMLYAAGHKVLLCGRTARDSIEVRIDDGASIIVPGPVHTNPADVAGPVDVVLLAVKDTQYGASTAWLQRLCDEHTVVCALQNGVEQADRLRPYCPTSVVVPAAIWIAAETQPEGWVRVRTTPRLVLPGSPGPTVAAAASLASALDGSEIDVELDPDFFSDAWRKLLVNAVVGLMVPSGRRSGMFQRADVAALAREYLVECLAVARAEGAMLADGVVDEIIDMLAQSPEDMATSMLIDREAGRPLEWDIRNGVIQRKGAAHGIATPISDVLVPLLAAASDGPG